MTVRGLYWAVQILASLAGMIFVTKVANNPHMGLPMPVFKWNLFLLYVVIQVALSWRLYVINDSFREFFPRVIRRAIWIALAFAFAYSYYTGATPDFAIKLLAVAFAFVIPLTAFSAANSEKENFNLF